MRRWNLYRRQMGRAAMVMCMLAGILIGCGGGDDDDVEINNGLVSLAGADGAAIDGLTFDFPDATLFGFPGETATLEIGNGATTFILTLSGGTVINGTITPGATAADSCRLLQNPSEVGAGESQFDKAYDLCIGVIDAEDDIEFGSSGPGTVVLSFSNPGEARVESAPETVVLNVNDNGTATINTNTTPI